MQYTKAWPRSKTLPSPYAASLTWTMMTVTAVTNTCSHMQRRHGNYPLVLYLPQRMQATSRCAWGTSSVDSTASESVPCVRQWTTKWVQHTNAETYPDDDVHQHALPALVDEVLVQDPVSEAAAAPAAGAPELVVGNDLPSPRPGHGPLCMQCHSIERGESGHMHNNTESEALPPRTRTPTSIARSRVHHRACNYHSTIHLQSLPFTRHPPQSNAVRIGALCSSLSV